MYKFASHEFRFIKCIFIIVIRVAGAVTAQFALLAHSNKVVGLSLHCIGWCALSVYVSEDGCLSLWPQLHACIHDTSYTCHLKCRLGDGRKRMDALISNPTTRPQSSWYCSLVVFTPIFSTSWSRIFSSFQCALRLLHTPHTDLCIVWEFPLESSPNTSHIYKLGLCLGWLVSRNREQRFNF